MKPFKIAGDIGLFSDWEEDPKIIIQELPEKV